MTTDTEALPPLLAKLWDWLMAPDASVTKLRDQLREEEALFRAALAQRQQVPEGDAQMASPQDGFEFWLWKNGDHFLAFRHLYPCFTPGGDPMVLGEPVGRAVFRRSFDRHCGGQGNAAAPALTAAPQAAEPVAVSDAQINAVIFAQQFWRIAARESGFSFGPELHDFARAVLALAPPAALAQPQEPPRSAQLTDEQAIAIAAYYDVTSAMVRDIYNRAHGISTPEDQR